jgi:transcriptional regulator with XRE-family HTH domain
LAISQASVGELLRGWRERRGLTQLELALQAEVSTRHLSFVETGRATPSRQMILHLADELDVPLRERNALLLAAGYAPAYVEAGLQSPQMAAIRSAVRDILAAHEPNPAVVVDRYWNVVEANAGLTLFTDGVADCLLQPPVNVLRIALDPRGAAPNIVNFGQWRAHLLARLRRQIARTQDSQLVALYAELRASNAPSFEVDVPGPDDVVVPLRFGHAGQELSFVSTIAVFGTPQDITVDELAIELFFPSDAATARYLRESLKT